MPASATTKTKKKRKPRRSFGAVRTLPTKSVQASYVHEGKRYNKTYPPGTKPKVIEDYFAVVPVVHRRGQVDRPEPTQHNRSRYFPRIRRWLACPGRRAGGIRSHY